MAGPENTKGTSRPTKDETNRQQRAALGVQHARRARLQRGPSGPVIRRGAAGVYLPLLAEAFGGRALRIERALDGRLRGSRLEWLLWTQFVVATTD
jgi:hypothetical protein